MARNFSSSNFMKKKSLIWVNLKGLICHQRIRIKAGMAGKMRACLQKKVFHKMDLVVDEKNSYWAIISSRPFLICLSIFLTYCAQKKYEASVLLWINFWVKCEPIRYSDVQVRQVSLPPALNQIFSMDPFWTRQNFDLYLGYSIFR